MSQGTEPPFFVTGGTLAADARSYVARRADRELRDALQGGAFCYVLNTRQVGKSSLMIRTAHALREAGRTTVVLDITAGGFNLTPEAWYGGLLLQLAEQLARFLQRPELEDILEEAFLARPELGPAQRFFHVLESVALPATGTHGLAVFLDEIDAVRLLPFPADELFVGIRALYNRRAEQPFLERLTFCLIGVATPAQLIANPLVSPFNIGKKIVLTDFTVEDAAPLATSLPGGAPALERVLFWTGGHPYLTQRLCAHLVETNEPVDTAVERLFFTHAARESDDNLAFVAARLLRGEDDIAALLELYGRVRAGKRVPDDPTSPLCDTLHLAGVVRTRTDGTLTVRNRLYEQVFNLAWVKANLPDGELRRQRAAFRRGAVRTGMLSGGIVAAMGGLTAWALRNARRADDAAQRADHETGEATRARQVADINSRLARESQHAAETNQRRAERLAGERARALQEKEKALQERETALREKEAALQERERALQAERQARGEADRANQIARRNLGRVELTLALRALRNAETELAYEHLRAALRPGQLTPEQTQLARFCLDALDRSAPRRLWQRTLPATASALASSTDKKGLLVGTIGGHFLELETQTGTPRRKPYRQPSPISVVADLGGGRLASGGSDSRVYLWGGPRSLPPLVHTETPGTIHQLTPSRDGNRLISSGKGGCVVWDTRTGKEISRVWDDDIGGRWSAKNLSAIVMTHAGRFTNADESQLAFAAYGYVSNLADVATGKMIHGFGTPRDAPQAAPDWIYQFVPSPDPKVFALVGHYRSGGGGGGACLYNVETGRAVSKLMTSPALPRAGSITEDGTLLAVGDDSGSVLVWDLKAGLVRGGPFSLYDSNRFVTGVGWLPDNDRLVTQTATGEVQLWSLTHRKVVGTRFRDSASYLLTPDKRQLVVSDTRGGLTLWQLPSRPKTLVLRFSPTENGFNREETPLDSYTWASWLDETGTSLVVVDLRSRQILRHSQLLGNPIEPELSPEGRFLGLLSINSLLLWDLQTNQQVGSVEGFFPDHARLKWEKGRATLLLSSGTAQHFRLPD